MVAQPRHVSIRVPLELLNVCRICGELHGTVVRGETSGDGATAPTRELHQQCGCAAEARVQRWDDYDFNQAVALCRCCGRRLLMSGMRWSEWFCGDCLPLIEELNARCRAIVVPSSRQTLMTTIAEEERGLRQPLPEFAAALGDWFDRVERLELHARRVVHDNLHGLGLDTLDTDVTLGEYLERLPSSTRAVQDALRSLAAEFAVPAVLLQGIA